MSSELLKAAETIVSCSEEEIELEGGVAHPIEELEELRLLLKSFLKPNLLDSLLLLYKELDKEPRYPEMYAWFCRNGHAGRECKYAVAALEKFKESRIDKLEEALNKSLDAIKGLRES